MEWHKTLHGDINFTWNTYYRSANYDLNLLTTHLDPQVTSSRLESKLNLAKQGILNPLKKEFEFVSSMQRKFFWKKLIEEN